MDDDLTYEKNTDSFDEKSSNKPLRQFAAFINDFSSQYGREDGFAFTALNLASGPSKYPSYGDYGECFSLRTYGPWSTLLGSSMKQPKKEVFKFISKDFIELKYDKKVWIESIGTYEIYHPGSVVAHYAYDYENTKWMRIWTIFDDKNFKNNHEARIRNLPSKSSRIFRPKLTRKYIFTDLIRLEFEDSNQAYLSGFDAVEMSGSVDEPLNISNLSILNTNDYEEPVAQNQTNILDMPIDVLNDVFKKLDLESLLKLRLTCRKFYSACSNAAMYKEVDLKPYWYFVNDSFIWTLTKVCSQISYLDLSWTKNLSHLLIKQLLHSSSKHITTLKLACCSYITNEIIEYICYYCTHITEFDLQSCKNVENFFPLSRLQLLQNLNLYRTNCDTLGIVKIVTYCKKLKYLNLGCCIKIDAFDYVLNIIASDCPNIKGLDLWRAERISFRGIEKLSEYCHALEELDLGWIKIQRYECLQMLIQNCNRLKKLCLAGVRVTNVELNLIASFCSKIEQLDLLGSLNVTPNEVENVLKSCKNLKLLDVSFCPSIDMITSRLLTHKYPHCSIKKSFQN